MNCFPVSSGDNCFGTKCGGGHGSRELIFIVFSQVDIVVPRCAVKMWPQVHKSEIVMNDLNPLWKPQEPSVQVSSPNHTMEEARCLARFAPQPD